MKITSIQQQKKNPERVNVFIDGKFSIGLESKLLVDFNLYKGKEIDDSLVQEIIRKDTGEKIKGMVLDLISKRPRSEKEIRDYIARKFYEKRFEIDSEYKFDLVENAIRELKDFGMINDKSFARWYVQNRNDFNPRGKALLSLELLQKGVSKNIITQILNSEIDNELALAKSLAEKKIRTLNRFTDEKKKEKLSAFLMRKGFGWDIIKKVVS